MRSSIVIFYIIITSCKLEINVPEWTQYYDTETKEIFQNGIKNYQANNLAVSDSLFTIVIKKAGSKLSKEMPQELNPYFYRGNISMELRKFERALSDFEYVAADTTTNIPIILARAECNRILQKDDQAIILYTKLLSLKFDSSMILPLRAKCYLKKGLLTEACTDYKRSKELGADSSSIYKLSKICE